jgi:NodT family efflux transporter outer membrane factor (OMF) lipoprotein
MRLAAVLLLAACDLSPKYLRPTVEVPERFKETWRPASPRDAMLRGPWWKVFGEPELDALEAELEAGNQNIRQAYENFVAARALVGQARAAYYPTVSLAPAYNRAGIGSANTQTQNGVGHLTASGQQAQGFNVINSFSIPADVSWMPDLWGRVRNTVRQNRYAAQASAADLANTRLVQQAALAEFYFQLRGQDALAELYTRTVIADERALEIARARVATGVDSEEAVAEAEVALANAMVAATGVATNRALYEHAIAALIGRPASRFVMLHRALATQVPEIPVGLPSQLLERRPDIAAAERAVAQANAAIGVAKSAYFPALNLSASGGLQSGSLTTLFSVPALFFALGAAATQVLFDGGLRKHTVEQYTAAWRASVAAYRQTVLTAFREVEDYAATARTLSAQIARQREAVAAAQKFHTLAIARYSTGIDPYLNVLVAETTLLGDEEQLVILRVSQLTAVVQLVQALGGGWEASQLAE